jgi:hypothetical protein
MTALLAELERRGIAYENASPMELADELDAITGLETPATSDIETAAERWLKTLRTSPPE